MYNMKFFCIILCLYPIRLFSQCMEENRAFSVGEKLRYYAYYNLGKIWIKAGEAYFAVDEENGNYLFTVSAWNLPGWDWLYHVKTMHKASMTKQFKPLYLKASVAENKNRHNEEHIYKGNTVYKHSENNAYPQGKDTTYTIKPCSWDIINAVYVARNVNLKKYKRGETIPFFVNFGDSTNVIYGKVLGKERIKNREGVEFDCLKCTASVVEGTIFSSERPVYVWITDDDFRIPVLIESKISVGGIKVFLYEFQTNAAK